MKVKKIKQEVEFDVKPGKIYNALVDPKIHSQFTGSKATNEGVVGGKFSAYDGYISGTNLKMESGKLLVQKWTCTDWPEGHYSEVTFKLTFFNKGSKLVFTQKNIPEDQVDSISQGWIDFYWDPLKVYFESD